MYSPIEISTILMRCNDDAEIEQTVDITFSLKDTAEEILELAQYYNKIQKISPYLKAVKCSRELSLIRIKQIAAQGNFKL